MGNKGAVGVRLEVSRGEKKGEGWEVLTWVPSHAEIDELRLTSRPASSF